MASKSINLTGTPGKQYDLDTLSSVNTRTSSNEELLVQVWYWNPQGINAYLSDTEKYEQHKKPNPPKVQLGQVWLSKLVPTDFKEE